MTLLQQQIEEAEEKLITPWDYYNDTEGTTRFLKEDQLDEIIKSTYLAVLQRIEEDFRSSEMTPNTSGYIGVKEAKDWVYNIISTLREEVNK
jgi:uncharacterized protein (UPF0305 family)